MVLFDGILYRLTEEERDAIIAHELATWPTTPSGTGWSPAPPVASPSWRPPPSTPSSWLSASADADDRHLADPHPPVGTGLRPASGPSHRPSPGRPALWKIHADQPFRGLIEFLSGPSTRPLARRASRRHPPGCPERRRPEVDGIRGCWAAAAWPPGAPPGCGCRSSSPVSVGASFARIEWPALPLVLMDVALFVLFWLGLRKTARSRRRLQRARPAWRGDWPGWRLPCWWASSPPMASA